MRVLLLILALTTAPAFAATGNIKCTAESYKNTVNGKADYLKQELLYLENHPSLVKMAVEIGGRAYSLSGSPIENNFLITQSWGEGYTFGFITRAAFNAEGILTLTQVEESVIHRLACKKD